MSEQDLGARYIGWDNILGLDGGPNLSVDHRLTSGVAVGGLGVAYIMVTSLGSPSTGMPRGLPWILVAGIVIVGTLLALVATTVWQILKQDESSAPDTGDERRPWRASAAVGAALLVVTSPMVWVGVDMRYDHLDTDYMVVIDPSNDTTAYRVKLPAPPVPSPPRVTEGDAVANLRQTSYGEAVVVEGKGKTTVEMTRDGPVPTRSFSAYGPTLRGNGTDSFLAHSNVSDGVELRWSLQIDVRDSKESWQYNGPLEPGWNTYEAHVAGRHGHRGGLSLLLTPVAFAGISTAVPVYLVGVGILAVLRSDRLRTLRGRQ